MKKLLLLMVLCAPASAETWWCVENTGLRFCGDSDTITATTNGFAFNYKQQVNQLPWEYGVMLMDCLNDVYKTSYSGWVGMTRPLGVNYQFAPDFFLCPTQVQWKRDANQ